MECVVCEEVMTQPLCAACLEEEVAAWLQERVPERPELLFRLRDVGEELGSFGGTMRCFKCKGVMTVCGRCYAEHVDAWLARVQPLLIPEFRVLFGLAPMEGRFVLPSPLRAQA